MTSDIANQPNQAQPGNVDGSADEVVLPRFPWLTNRRIVFFVLAWMLLFGVISAFISNPFQTEPSATATPNYWHVMFLHGLLIGIVALGGLLACQVFDLQSRHVRLWIALGALSGDDPGVHLGVFSTRLFRAMRCRCGSRSSASSRSMRSC